MEAVFLVNIRYQGLTNTGRQIVRATEFCTVTTNICGSSGGKLATFEPSGDKNFKVVPRLIQNQCTPHPTGLQETTI